MKTISAGYCTYLHSLWEDKEGSEDEKEAVHKACKHFCSDIAVKQKHVIRDLQKNLGNPTLGHHMENKNNTSSFSTADNEMLIKAF